MVTMAKTIGVLFLLAARTCLLAEDFWVKKKFPEWTDKEAWQMIGNSPWAQKVEVPLGSMVPGRAGRGPPGGGGRSRGGGGFEDAASAALRPGPAPQVAPLEDSAAPGEEASNPNPSRSPHSRW